MGAGPVCRPPREANGSALGFPTPSESDWSSLPRRPHRGVTGIARVLQSSSGSGRSSHPHRSPTFEDAPRHQLRDVVGAPLGGLPDAEDDCRGRPALRGRSSPWLPAAPRAAAASSHEPTTHAPPPPALPRSRATPRHSGIATHRAVWRGRGLRGRVRACAAGKTSCRPFRLPFSTWLRGFLQKRRRATNEVSPPIGDRSGIRCRYSRGKRSDTSQSPEGTPCRICTMNRR